MFKMTEVKFPDKCQGCPYIKCRVLEIIRKSEKLRAGTKVSDIKEIYKKKIVPMGGKTEKFQGNTPNEIIVRLKKSKWIYTDRKDEYTKGRLGRIPNILMLSKKAENYLKFYPSFLDGPLCWKWQEERKKGKIEKEIEKPAIIVEEIRVVER